MTHLSLCFLKVCISLSPAHPQAHSLLGCVTVALSVFLRDASPCLVIVTFSLGQRMLMPPPSTPSSLFSVVSTHGLSCRSWVAVLSVEGHIPSRRKGVIHSSWRPHMQAGATKQLRTWWTHHFIAGHFTPGHWTVSKSS